MAALEVLPRTGNFRHARVSFLFDFDLRTLRAGLGPCWVSEQTVQLKF